ncbi:copper amine oxidase [Paenibacillus woosongensis]|uniref:Copper amine oxidase n=1 Tax=Paenibacillus woosongensis TaxID=307580 RepID=A0AA95L2I6_9BACL|nr:copper amine oxidase [Paenibacillus woosongensis]WHX50561.1 copper amine oxidase [Paenibacillus woosongensis]
MKKWVSIAAAFLLGVVVTLSAGDVSAQVKSLIGKKVTGEYTVFVNGVELADKGAIIDSKANVPARALSEAMGADVQVSGKVITITTDQSGTDSAPGTLPSTDNPYVGQPEASLEKIKSGLENDTLKVLGSERSEILADIEILKTSGINGEPSPGLEAKEKQLEQYNADIKKYTEELRLVNEALQLLEK